MIFSNLNIEQFLSVALVHFLAVVSPGPDFMVILKQSVVNGKKSAIYTSLGISFGILVHVFYCIVGIGFFISTNILVYNLIKYLGAFYLLYIGLLSFLSKNSKNLNDKSFSNYKFEKYLYKPFIVGFLTNIFNPKATLFFLSLFTFIINPEVPYSIQLFYGFWMCFITALWFCFISLLINLDYFKKIITKYSLIIDRLLGVVLIYISIKILLL